MTWLILYNIKENHALFATKLLLSCLQEKRGVHHRNALLLAIEISQVATGLLHNGLLVEIDDVLLVGLHALVVLARADNEFVPCTESGTSGDEVSADDVLLHTLEIVLLTTDGSLVEHLGGLLERCC